MKDNFVKKIQENKQVYLISLIFSVILYSPMLVLQLTNTYDGFWLQEYSSASKWEISLGRWGLFYIDKIHKGLHIDPINGILTLAIFCLGMLLILDVLEVKSKLISVIAIVMTIGTISVSSVLGYRMTCLSYSIAFLLSAIAIFFIVNVKNKYLSVGLSIISICLFMSLYQGYLTVVIVLSIFYLLSRLLKEKVDNKACIAYILKTFVSLLIGGLLYYLLVKVHIKIFGIQLNNYHGASEISIASIIKALPASVLSAYQTFFDFHLEKQYKIYAFGPQGFRYLAILVIAIFILVGLVIVAKRKRIIGILVYCGLIISLPIAGYAALMLAPGNGMQIHMTIGLVLILPLFLVILYPYISKIKLTRYASIIVAILVLYNSSLQVLIDQNMMKDGYRYVETLGYSIVADLSAEDMLNQNYSYCFIGRPSDNEWYDSTVLNQKANAYATIGQFWLGGDCALQSYKGLFNYRLKYNLPISDMMYEEYAFDEISSSMPCYPDKGYIQLVGDKVYIKISD